MIYNCTDPITQKKKSQKLPQKTEAARSSCEPSLQVTTQHKVQKNLSNMSHHDHHSTGPQESVRALHHHKCPKKTEKNQGQTCKPHDHRKQIWASKNTTGTTFSSPEWGQFSFRRFQNIIQSTPITAIT